jgi:transposase
VEGYREGGKVKQRTIHNFGNLEGAQKSGILERLLVSGQRYTDKLSIISELNKGNISPYSSKIIGLNLVFSKLWSDLGMPEIIKNSLKGANYSIPLERVIFMTVLQRLLRPGSDRAGIKWLEEHEIPGIVGIQLHHCYRAMKWLGKPLKNQPSEYEALSSSSPQELGSELIDDVEYETALGLENDTSNNNNNNNNNNKNIKEPKVAISIRRTKDNLEEQIFMRRYNLLTQLKFVFFDTTSIYFEGEGGIDLGKRGHSKDHRPDLNQVVVGLVLDNYGYPVCTDIWPGNTADVTTLVPIAEKLKKRFRISKVCIVADRGMISKNTIAKIYELKWSYILGAKMRNIKEVQEVLGDTAPFFEVTGERQKSSDPAPLKVKDVHVDGSRYVVCLNEEEARKDRHTRENILSTLELTLNRGDKSLIGNRGYKRFIKSGKDTFAIDYEKAKEDEKYDGKFILKTDLDIGADQVAYQYKQLLQVESMFRATKSLLQTRPVYHQSDENISGHIWCSFLALMLRKRLIDLLAKECEENELPMEWADVIRDLEKLTVAKFTLDGKTILLRSAAAPGAVKAFKALGIRLPDHIKVID